MADEQDRGAYTPQSDAPLAFDARRANGGGRPGSTALIISGVILMGLIIAVLLIYRHGARHTGQPPELVGAPVGQTKEAPPSSAQPEDQTAGLQVYKTEVPPTTEAPSAAPTFAPAPEQPQPIPAARAPAPTPAPAPVAAPIAPVASAPLRPAIAPPPVVKAPPVVKPAVKTAAAPTPPLVKAPPPVKVAAAPKPKPKPAPKTEASDDTSDVPGVVFATNTPSPATAAAKAKSKPAAPAATGGGFVQIGAFSSQALADKGWHDVGAALPGRLSGKTKKVETVSKDGKTFYRTSVTGFASSADAESFCAALKAAGHTCFAR